MAGGRRNVRNVRKEEEEDYPDFASQAAYDDAINEHYTTTREFQRGFQGFGFPEYGRPEEEGMITGAWDKAKEIGGEWWKNISSDKGEYRREFDARWLKKLGHSGLPRLENYIGDDAEADFDRDWREYWDTHPDNLSLY